MYSHTHATSLKRTCVYAKKYCVTPQSLQANDGRVSHKTSMPTSYLPIIHGHLHVSLDDICTFCAKGSEAVITESIKYRMKWVWFGVNRNDIILL
jgi:hypothetical protein